VSSGKYKFKWHTCGAPAPSGRAYGVMEWKGDGARNWYDYRAGSNHVVVLKKIIKKIIILKI
jgi:hypothetical protein